MQTHQHQPYDEEAEKCKSKSYRGKYAYFMEDPNPPDSATG